MRKVDLDEIIQNGESSSIEFKSEKVGNEALTKEIGALLNFSGGRILLGVEDDGSISGLLTSGKKWEEKIINLCSNNIEPALIPHWETLVIDGKSIGIVTLPDNAPDKPYKVKSGSKWIIYIRVGTSSREATREQEARLYYASPLCGSFILKPIINASIGDLDLRRIYDYFSTNRVIRGRKIPAIDNAKEWKSVLYDTELLADANGDRMPTIAAVLLFGKDSRRLVKNSGISVCVFAGEDKSAPVRERAVLNAPLIPLYAADGTMLFPGLVELVLNFVKRNIAMREERGGGQRVARWDYPLNAIREALVNALIHRDYTIKTDVELSIYSNRLEIISPGRLPNTITIERMKAGCRSARNELLRDVMRDCGYVEDMGRGISHTIMPEMEKHNGTEPEFKEEETRFTLILRK